MSTAPQIRVQDGREQVVPPNLADVFKDQAVQQQNGGPEGALNLSKLKATETDRVVSAGNFDVSTPGFGTIALRGAEAAQRHADLAG